MTIPKEAPEKAQVAIRMFPSGANFLLDITSTEEFRNQFLRSIELKSREKHDRFVGHYFGMERGKIRTCTYESRSGTKSRANLEIEAIQNFCTKNNIELTSSTFEVSKVED